MPERDGASPAEERAPVPPGGERPTVVMDLDWRAVAMAVGVFLVLSATYGLVRAAPRALTFCTIGSLLALALNPLVGGFQRRTNTRRGVAVATVVTGFVLAFGIILLVLGPPAAREAGDLQEQIPEAVADLGDLPFIGRQLEENNVPERVEAFLEDLPSRLAGDTAPIANAARSIVGGLLAALATVVVTIALLLDGERLVRGARRAIPRRHRATTDRIGDLFYRVVGKYFAGSLLVAGVAGTATLVAGLILGVPLTPLLAVWVALFDLVPQIGGAAGGIPFVLLAFTQGATTGVIAALFFVLYLQFENNVLSPLIVGDAVDLSPPATMVAALIGVSTAGVPGALVAVPLLGVAKAVYLELRPPPPDDLAAEAEEDRAARKGRPGLLSRLITRLRRR